MSTAPLHVPGPQDRQWPRPPLRVVPVRRARRARAPFVGALLGVLALGLLALLLLNTALAQDSVRLHRLQQEHAVVLDRAEELESEILAASAPNELAKRAAALGMVPSGTPVFLRLPDGRITGSATPAAADPHTAAGGPLPGTDLGVVSRPGAADDQRTTSGTGR